MKTQRSLRPVTPAPHRWLALGIWVVEAVLILTGMLIVSVKRELQDVPVSAVPK